MSLITDMRPGEKPGESWQGEPPMFGDGRFEGHILRMEDGSMVHQVQMLGSVWQRRLMNPDEIQEVIHEEGGKTDH